MTRTIVAPTVTPFFDKGSSTFSYVVKDPDSSHCAVIDSVMEFDHASGHTSYVSADAIIEYVRSQKLTLDWLIETHVHADHMSAAPYIQQHLGGKIGIGAEITVVQQTFGDIYNEGQDFARNGQQFDQLFKEGDHYHVGEMACRAMHTPGHTPACMTHIMSDAVFVGDTLFMPDGGTARADFPGGDAATLYDSIQKILDLPECSRLFMCHDYCPNGRALEYETTVSAQRAQNIHVHDGISKEAFVEMRTSRDKTLGMPQLILPSIQVNMRAGHFPEPESNGRVYLKLPVNIFDQ
ncbi:MAG: MBL fold metallo-hydrolase [Pseudomonadales bacterium]